MMPASEPRLRATSDLEASELQAILLTPAPHRRCWPCCMCIPGLSRSSRPAGETWASFLDGQLSKPLGDDNADEETRDSSGFRSLLTTGV
mmetsp:Transcript_46553/g.129368  ORF Transcript_46553/g.129368 Transcript_46553/m.129368 type:complete len:90 (-) Transcript_46553:211-480(-)|eukprot:7348643-Prymnesium_polylepis.1